MERAKADMPLPARVRLTEALERMVAFYEAEGKAARASEYRARRETWKQESDGSL